MVALARRIDELHYENFNVPVLMHQNRVLRARDDNWQRPAGHAPAEQDYADARPDYAYHLPAWPLREQLTTQETAQLRSVNQAVDMALRQRTVPLALLRRALSVQQMQEFRVSVNEVAEPSEVLYGDGMPEPLRSYNVKLNKADLMWARFERAPSAPKYGSRQRLTKPGKLEDRAQSLYEDALECLDEILTSAERGDWGREMPHRLQQWLDRSVRLGFGGADGTDPHSVPRVRGSKSVYAHDSGLPKLSKRVKRQYCALRALLVAGCQLAFVLPDPAPEGLTLEQQRQQSEVLRSKLRALKTQSQR